MQLTPVSNKHLFDNLSTYHLYNRYGSGLPAAFLYIAENHAGN